jgi:hypothetical protein
MFYFNTKYAFSLASGSPDNIAGGIIAASAMFAGQLLRREFDNAEFLQHRYFDPQLYLAGLDPRRGGDAVFKLGTYPWFGVPDIPSYDTKQHKKQAEYKRTVGPKVVAGWTRGVPSGAQAVREAAHAAVKFQLDLGCDGIILPTPALDAPSRGVQDFIVWTDAGIDVCRELKVTGDVFATVALCDTAIANHPALEHPILAAVTDQIAARSDLSGAYLVIETRDEDTYSFESQDTVRGLMVVIDDLIRGAGRRVLLNYAGTFGAVASAMGASVWATGPYKSQRRLKGSDLYRKPGASQYPRYFSLSLAGDLGLEEDIPTAVKAKLFKPLMTATPPAEALHRATAGGLGPDKVPEWTYRKGNVTAACAHYNTAMQGLSTTLDALGAPERIAWVEAWLGDAAKHADRLTKAGINHSNASELVHQQIWLDVFREWRARARV